MFNEIRVLDGDLKEIAVHNLEHCKYHIERLADEYAERMRLKISNIDHSSDMITIVTYNNGKVLGFSC